VLLLQGTYPHEPSGTLDIFRRLAASHSIHVADRIQQVALTSNGSWAKSSGWRFDRIPENALTVFSCLPSVNKANVAATVGATGAAEAAGRASAALLGAWGVVNRQARSAGITTVGVSHGTVSGCVTEHGVPMAGLDHEFTTTALFSAEASAFMLGHIHLHQVWREGNRLVAYAGSIRRLHYGEERQRVHPLDRRREWRARGLRCHAGATHGSSRLRCKAGYRRRQGGCGRRARCIRARALERSRGAARNRRSSSCPRSPRGRGRGETRRPGHSRHALSRRRDQSGAQPGGEGAAVGPSNGG
jgi:hypothetical protein